MSVVKINKVMLQCTCDSCEHKWETDKVPQRCAKCKIRTWNRPTRLSAKAHLTFKGKTQSVAAWSRELGLAKTTIPWRQKQGFPIEQVLSKEDWRKQ